MKELKTKQQFGLTAQNNKIKVHMMRRAKKNDNTRQGGKRNSQQICQFRRSFNGIVIIMGPNRDSPPLIELNFDT